MASEEGYPPAVARLVEAFQRFPGVGRRSAERMAFWLLKANAAQADDLLQAIAGVREGVRHCPICWNIADGGACRICTDASRDGSTVLVVEQPRDLTSLEQTAMYRGTYHVLMGRLDPFTGVGPEALTLDDLLARVREPARNARGVRVAEVVLGLNPDLEGDTTGLLVAERLQGLGVRVTRLARGLPTGSQISLANRAVLGDAIAHRQALD